MRGRFKPGTRVETVKPDKESKDWDAEALKQRRWGALGFIRDVSDRHGLIYQVEHEDKTLAWYEPRELVECSENQAYTPKERLDMLQRMRNVTSTFYSLSTASGCHALIEYTGLMNEFIRVCEEAHERGQQFPFANTHGGDPLPFQAHNLAYLAEKLNCIYGPALLSSEEGRRQFIDVLFDGAYKLVPSEPTKTFERPEDFTAHDLKSSM